MQSQTLNFHQGAALLKLASSFYVTLREVILEAIQNAIDADATKISVTISRKNRIIIISDNGTGVTPERLGRALSQIAMSIKPKNKYGRHNLGFISPLGKAEWHRFTSHSKDGYNEWTFNPDELGQQKTTLQVPLRVVGDLRYSPKADRRLENGIRYVDWKSQLAIVGYTTDSIVGKLDIHELRDDIIDRYSIGMRELGTVVTIIDSIENGENVRLEARATQFTGRPLKEEYYPRNHNGRSEAVVRLFRATRKGKAGHKARVLFGEIGDKYRIRQDQMVVSTRGILDEKVAHILTSGIFEGEILTSTATVNPDRKGFIKDDGLVTFCLHLAQWYEDVGKDVLEEVTDETRNARHQEVGVTVLEWVAHLLRQPEWKQVFEIFQKGTVEIGSRRGTSTDKPELSLAGGALKARAPKEAKNNEGTEEDGKKDTHPVFTVTGNKGKPRIIVQHRGIGLAIDHSEMMGDMRPYVFHRERGMIEFNTSHPFFVQCDESGPMKLAQYEQFIIMGVIALEKQSQDVRHIFSGYLEDTLRMEVFRIQSEAMVLRSRRKRKTSEVA